MATDFFLKLEGIKGESKDKEHKDEIDILSWSMGMTQSGTTHLGGGSGSGKVSVQDISVVKYVDKSSPILAKHCANGKHIPKGWFYVRKAGEDPLTYMQYDLEKVLISSYSTGGSGGEDRVTESLSLNFGKIKFEYTEQLETGKGGPKTEFTVDIPQNVTT